jgi:hypothetical protein
VAGTGAGVGEIGAGVGVIEAGVGADEWLDIEDCDGQFDILECLYIFM